MKRTLATLLVCGAAMWAGCSDSVIHVDKLRAALQGLPPDQNAKLEESLQDIASNNYAAALKPLRSIALTAKLTTEQRNILEDTAGKVKLAADKK